MAELDEITVQGFKSIASIEKLELGPINVIIGPNGSGKSNFLEVFAFLNAVRAGRLQDYVKKAGGADRVLHFGSKVTPRLHLWMSFANGVNQYDIDLVPTDIDELVPESENVYYWDKIGHPSPYQTGLESNGKEAAISDDSAPTTAPVRLSVADHVRRHLDSWRIYHFHDTSSGSPMKKTGDVHDNRFLRSDGSNLAAFLFYLREKQPSAYQLIRNIVRQVAPFFGDFQLAPQKLNPDKILLEWRHKSADAYFNVSSLSDGSLRFIALATLLLQPKESRPPVILLDEPELGLHPFAITLLASMIRQASVDSQVILSTQSPMLLDHFEPQDVLVAELVQGATQFSRLDSSRLTDWLEDYSLGQLWEKNELGGRPGAR